jgi:hypothetical protein
MHEIENNEPTERKKKNKSTETQKRRQKKRISKFKPKKKIIANSCERMPKSTLDSEFEAKCCPGKFHTQMQRFLHEERTCIVSRKR